MPSLVSPLVMPLGGDAPVAPDSWNVDEFGQGSFGDGVFGDTPVAPAGDPWMLRDEVWRWTRRLRRTKCSVISVAIDDNYSPNEGFVLTALALDIGTLDGLDRVPWRGGTYANPGASGTSSNHR